MDGWFWEGKGREGSDEPDVAGGVAVVVSTKVAFMAQRNTPCWSEIPLTSLEQFCASLCLQDQRCGGFWGAVGRQFTPASHATRAGQLRRGSRVPLAGVF